jgi:hypothetical protein
MKVMIQTHFFEYKHISLRIQAHFLSKKNIQKQAYCTRNELIV